jgi:hypothetical protein
MQKVLGFVSYANRTIAQYFGVVTSFDILICRGSWEMEVQVISRSANNGGGGRSGAAAAVARKGARLQPDLYDITGSIGLTDYRMEEIVIRCDAAKYGHYLHELIHGVISKDHSHQLREGLAWYFTLKLTERHRYVRGAYPSWIDHMYVYPVKKMAQIVGEEFLKDFALGKASIEVDFLPPDLQELFMPEVLFYAKKRYFR